MPFEIVTIEEVKHRLALPVGAVEADDSIESAIGSSVEYLKTVLETDFDYVASVTDTFFTTENRYPEVPNGMFRLRLSRGFLTSSTVTITYGEALTDLSETLASGDSIIDRTKGIVYVPETLVNNYISVQYSAGFSDTNAPPNWVKEAVLAYIPSLMNSMQPTNRSGEVEPVTKKTQEIAGRILESHMRGRAFQYRPLF